MGVMAVAMAAGLLASAQPARADTRIERHVALAPGGRLLIESDIGNVVVHGGAASGAAMVLTSGREDFEKEFEVRCEAVAGEARITVKRRSPHFSWGIWHDRTLMTVTVPHATAASLHVSGGGIEAAGLEGAAEMRSSGGSITLHDLTGAIDARSSGGEIEASDIRGALHVTSSGGGVHVNGVRGAVDALSSGGDVTLEHVAGDVSGRSSGGGVVVSDAGGKVTAGSSGGSVKVSFARGNAHGGDISSSGGGVEVRVDPAVGFAVDASSSGGSVECSLPVVAQGRISKRHLEGQLKGGGEPLKVRASGGGIHIEGL
jgi:DUF4097 and DUF4098 domain-containing protein YvlB